MTKLRPEQTVIIAVVLSWRERHDDAAAHVVPFLDRVVGLDGARVLEFGAGAGPISCALAPRVTSVLGLDIATQDVADGRRALAERGIGNVTLEAGPFEALLERCAAVAGEIDIFLLFAVLEHMTIDERLAVLALGKDVVSSRGSLCVFETPNRLLWWDHHTSQLPFFGMLDEPLALAYADRSVRPSFASDLRSARSAAGLALSRYGRGASHHEFELALGPLDGLIVAGGYEPELFPSRHVHREELYLARFARGLPDPPAPAFSRYWLDLVLRFDNARCKPLIEPWPFATDRSRGVAFTPWETLQFVAPDAWLEIPAAGASELHLGVESDPQGVEVCVTEPSSPTRPLAVAPSTTGTQYLMAPLHGTDASVTVTATPRTQLSFVGLRAG